MKFGKALVIGAGAFGTSIASVLSNNFEQVVLKVRSHDVYEGIKEGENKVYLPGIQLPKNISGAISWNEVEELVGDKSISSFRDFRPLPLNPTAVKIWVIWKSI